MKNKLKRFKYVKWYQWVILCHLILFIVLINVVDSMPSFWQKLTEMGTYEFMGVEYSYHLLYTMMHYGFLGTAFFCIGFVLVEFVFRWMISTIKKGVKKDE